MEHNLIQPVSVNGHGPTCFAALVVMADAAKLSATGEQVRTALQQASIPAESPADAWETVLNRALSILTHGLGGRQHAPDA